MYSSGYIHEKERYGPGTYLVNQAMTDCNGSGDSYVRYDVFMAECRHKFPCNDLYKDCNAQMDKGNLSKEGNRLYTASNYNNETFAAAKLVERLKNNRFPRREDKYVPSSLLCEEQRKAIEMVFDYRISMIMGGAGSGKTTLIKDLVRRVGNCNKVVLCAPTGKAARNLKDKTGFKTRTVHSALGLKPEEELSSLPAVKWEHVELVVVDESSMLTLELIAGIFFTMQQDCRLVLIGDPEQLPCVGVGNVMEDLFRVGVPTIKLEQNHRQCEDAVALTENVVNFRNMVNHEQLQYDDSFEFRDLPPWKVHGELVAEAVKCYQEGESVMVLSPYNRYPDLGVASLNKKITGYLKSQC